MRPSEEVMEARAAARHAREVKAWEEEQMAFAEASRIKEQLADMRRVLKVILEADALKSHAYERGDDDASIYEVIKGHLK